MYECYRKISDNTLNCVKVEVYNSLKIKPMQIGECVFSSIAYSYMYIVFKFFWVILHFVTTDSIDNREHRYLQRM